MKSLSRIHIWFPNIDHEIENIVKSCQSCEKVSNEPNNQTSRNLTHGTGQQTQWIECT